MRERASARALPGKDIGPAVEKGGFLKQTSPRPSSKATLRALKTAFYDYKLVVFGGNDDLQSLASQ
jgi:hypothetical protein